MWHIVTKPLIVTKTGTLIYAPLWIDYREIAGQPIALASKKCTFAVRNKDFFKFQEETSLIRTNWFHPTGRGKYIIAVSNTWPGAEGRCTDTLIVCQILNHKYIYFHSLSASPPQINSQECRKLHWLNVNLIILYFKGREIFKNNNCCKHRKSII